MDRSRPDGWTGASADAAAQSRRRLILDLETLVAEVARTRAAMFHAAEGVALVADEVSHIDGWADSMGLSIAPDGSVSARPVAVRDVVIGSTTTAEQDLPRVISQCVSWMNVVLHEAEQVDRDLSTSLSSVLSGSLRVTSDVGLKGADPEAWLAAHPPPSGAGTPAANSAWWKSLPQATKDYVIDYHPEWIGNRDGIPFTARDQANRNRLPTERQRLLARRASTPAGDAAALKIIDDKLASLDTIDTLLAQGDRQLLELDLTHDRAEAAIAVGNVDTADHVAVFTPGLTSTVQGIGGNDNDAANLKARTENILKNKRSRDSVAVVTWLGYQAPQTDGTFFTDDSVYLPDAARQGGASLATFLQGIDTSREGNVDLTALGHSYGSTTTGYALQHAGTGVDRVAFFGSPGISVSNAADLKVATGQVYYAEATYDPVGDLHRFGPDPSWIPGVKHLETHEATPMGDGGMAGITVHTCYLDDQTTSQHNLAALVAGHPEDVVYGNDVGAGDTPGVPAPLVAAAVDPLTAPVAVPVAELWALWLGPKA